MGMASLLNMARFPFNSIDLKEIPKPSGMGFVRVWMCVGVGVSLGGVCVCVCVLGGEVIGRCMCGDVIGKCGCGDGGWVDVW